MAPKDQKSVIVGPNDTATTLAATAAEVASIGKTPPRQRTAQQNERLQVLEQQRQDLLGDAAHPKPPAPPAPADTGAGKHTPR